MIKPGKKHKKWVIARAELIKLAVINGRITIEHGYPEGKCEDCQQWKPLTPDHIIKRSQGGSHDNSNIDWVCVRCHDKRDNMPKKEEKKKSTKAAWMKPHQCKNCKKTTEFFLCHLCKKASI